MLSIFFFFFCCNRSSLTGLNCPQFIGGFFLFDLCVVCVPIAVNFFNKNDTLWVMPLLWTKKDPWIINNPQGCRALVGMRTLCSVQQFYSPDLDKLGASKTFSCLLIQEVGERWLANASIFSPFVESQKDNSKQCFFINKCLSYLCV